MSEHAYAHVPVMAGRIAALLLPALTGPTPGGRPPVLIDATLGRAGHARAFLDAVPGLLLIGIDADAAAIEAGRTLAERYPGQVTVAHAFYDRSPRSPPRPGTAGSRASCSTSVSPPRSWTTRAVASPTHRTPRSTCAWTRVPG